jgi:hypothetical protein
MNLLPTGLLPQFFISVATCLRLVGMGASLMADVHTAREDEIKPNSPRIVLQGGRFIAISTGWSGNDGEDTYTQPFDGALSSAVQPVGGTRRTAQ